MTPAVPECLSYINNFTQVGVETGPITSQPPPASDETKAQLLTPAAGTDDNEQSALG